MPNINSWSYLMKGGGGSNQPFLTCQWSPPLLIKTVSYEDVKPVFDDVSPAFVCVEAWHWGVQSVAGPGLN